MVIGTTLLLFTLWPAQTLAAQDGTAAIGAAQVDANIGLGIMLLIVMGVILFVYKIALSGVRTARTLTTMESLNQTYWSTPSHIFGMFKRYVVYAPLIRTRHHSEFWLMKGWPTGVLPTRFQSLFIATLIGVNVYYCVLGIPWGTTAMLTALRSRTGTIAILNMAPLAMFSARTNILIPLLGIPYDTFNMMHRWLGRIIVAQAITHTVAYMMQAVQHTGREGLLRSYLVYGSEPQTGLIAVVGFVMIVISSMTFFRQPFYEIWHHLHILLIVMSTVALWYHLRDRPVGTFVFFFILTWVGDRIQRFLILIYRNAGAGGTQALVEKLPGEAVKVTIAIARPWTFKPGQHMFLTIPSIGLWASHPFAVAWSEPGRVTEFKLISSPLPIDPEKAPYDTTSFKMPDNMINIRPVASRSTTTSTTTSTINTSKTTITAIIRARSGFTRSLFERTNSQPSVSFRAAALIEGPYGLQKSFASYGTILLIAGGVGITHHLPYMQSLLQGYVSSTNSCRKLLLVWVINSSQHLDWIRPQMTEILAMDGRRDVLRIEIYVTSPVHGEEIKSASQTVQMFSGKPDIERIIEREGTSQVGAMGVSVCAPGILADEVRSVVRKRTGKRSVDFVEETFSW